MSPPQQRQATMGAFFGRSSCGKRIKSGQGKVAPTSLHRLRQAHHGSAFGTCPLCQSSFPLHKLEFHAAKCTGEMKVKSETIPMALSADSSTKASVTEPSLHPSAEPIPGLHLYYDFISEEDEIKILNVLDDEAQADYLPWKQANFNGTHAGKRWGVHCNLRDRVVSAAEHPLPSFFADILLPRLRVCGDTMRKCVPNEANAIDYRRNQNNFLKSHVDDRQLSKEPIANLSLAGDCVMEYTNTASKRNLAPAVVRVHLPRRCLQILTGVARYDFAHGIHNADLLGERRVSITMRESPLTSTSQTILSSSGDFHKHTFELNLVPSSLALVKMPKRRRMSLENAIVPTDEPIPGLHVFENFITVAEEIQILHELDENRTQPWQSISFIGSHREQQWGMVSPLWTREVRPPEFDLPVTVRSIIMPKLARITQMQGCVVNECNSKEYRRDRGDSLHHHVDDRAKHKEPIANLSIAGSCYMTFTNMQPSRNTCVRQRKVLLQPRTLFIMTGKARYDFSHGIDREDVLSERRVSVTCRQTILDKNYKI